MLGLGKKRTKLGKWLDKNSLTQEDLRQVSKVSRNTISKVCNDKEYSPSSSTIKKIMKAIRKVDPAARVDDFFDI